MINNEKRKSICRCIRNCISEFFGTYSLGRLVVYSVVLFCSVFFLDYLNVPTQYFQQIPLVIKQVLHIVIPVIVIIWLIDMHVIDLLRFPSVNLIDAIVLVGCISTCLYAKVRLLSIGSAIYVILALGICMVLLVVGLTRFIYRCNKHIQTETKVSNLIDLKDLYDNTFSHNPDTAVLLLEKDVDYDLLARDSVINQLYRSIIQCQPYQSYVISLEGEWGSGKTTIINNTKRLIRENEIANKDYICIDEFDPWLYGTQEALLLAMLETIIGHSGMQYSPSRFNLIVQEICETVSAQHWSVNLFHKMFTGKGNCSGRILKLKQRLENYLRSNNKTIVFFIDNLDRANDENIIFLFKLIAIVFDLPGIIYVLSFEKERINTILENTNHFDPRYTEKIIQQVIHVPVISEENAENLYITCIGNLLENYNVPVEEYNEYKTLADYIVKKTMTVRSFKRMVNSVFPLVFCDNTYLKKSDLLALEVIHFYDPELFYTIYRNPKYFISHDRNIVDAFTLSRNIKTFNDDSVTFFNKLFSEHEDALALLGSIFPYVNRYANNAQLESDCHTSDLNDTLISKQSRICSGKYFDLYFSYSSNNYIKVRTNVEEMIGNINNVKATTVKRDSQEIGIIVNKHLESLKKEEQNEWVERLQMHLSDINTQNILSVAVSLYNYIYYLDDNHTEMFRLDARSRMEYIIALLLNRCLDEEFAGFISLIEHDYQRLQVIRSIHYWLNSEKINQTETNITRVALIWNRFMDICNYIVEKNINLYDDSYYYHKNVWGLYHFYKQCENIEELAVYITNHLSDESVYRILWDIISLSIGNQYMYSIKDENFNLFISDVDLLDAMLEKRPPKTKDEEFVRRVYDAYRKGTPNEWGDKGISVSACAKLQL